MTSHSGYGLAGARDTRPQTDGAHADRRLAEGIPLGLVGPQSAGLEAGRLQRNREAVDRSGATHHQHQPDRAPGPHCPGSVFPHPKFARGPVRWQHGAWGTEHGAACSAGFSLRVDCGTLEVPHSRPEGRTTNREPGAWGQFRGQRSEGRGQAWGQKTEDTRRKTEGGGPKTEG